MRVLSKLEGRTSRRINRAVAILLPAAALAYAVVFAHSQQAGGPTPSAPGAGGLFRGS